MKNDKCVRASGRTERNKETEIERESKVGKERCGERRERKFRGDGKKNGSVRDHTRREDVYVLYIYARHPQAESSLLGCQERGREPEQVRGERARKSEVGRVKWKRDARDIKE